MTTAIAPTTDIPTRRYGWLGAKQRSAETPTGVIRMGDRVYVPQLGRFLQVDPIPGGSANAYDYANQDPVNVFDLDGRMAAGQGGAGSGVGVPAGFSSGGALLGRGAKKLVRAYEKPTPAAREAARIKVEAWFVKNARKIDKYMQHEGKGATNRIEYPMRNKKVVFERHDPHPGPTTRSTSKGWSTAQDGHGTRG